MSAITSIAGNQLRCKRTRSRFWGRRSECAQVLQGCGVFMQYILRLHASATKFKSDALTLTTLLRLRASKIVVRRTIVDGHVSPTGALILAGGLLAAAVAAVLPTILRLRTTEAARELELTFWVGVGMVFSYTCWPLRCLVKEHLLITPLVPGYSCFWWYCRT